MSGNPSFRNVLVTGGCGFIGANFIHFLFREAGFPGRVVNVDKLTYAGNPDNLSTVARDFGERYVFERCDILETSLMSCFLERYNIDLVVHFAAETHVDRSILGPGEFVRTNIEGTFSLLEAVRRQHAAGRKIRLHHIGTDEVFGSIPAGEKAVESSPYAPRSPYAASKAAADHLVRAFFHTYGLDVTISTCSNNYGPYQFPEKLVPLMICNMLEGTELPVYGDGKHERDWLYVRDHCSAVWSAANGGGTGETFNIAAGNGLSNLELVNMICEVVAPLAGGGADRYRSLIRMVPDRPGHDRRYALDCGKIARELGWKPSVDLRTGLGKTVSWYLENPGWLRAVKSGEYRTWLERNYAQRA